MVMKRIALIPAYEPDTRMTGMVVNLKNRGFDVVVVNDGSSADKNALFDQASECAVVLTHEMNRGKGAALKTGFGYIREKYQKDYIVVTVDADGQHDIEDVVRVCMKAEANPGHLVLGSRQFNQDRKVPLRSRFGNTVTRKVFQITTGLKISDTQTGLRAFDSSLTDLFLGIEGDRYEYEMNMLLICSREKVPVDEIPIRTIYLDNNSSSHFDAIKDSVRIYGEIFKFAASSFLGFLVDYGMFAILSAVTGALIPDASAGVILSNVGARATSSVVNFTVNRKFVFHSEENVGTAALQYFSLVACILAGNTFLLNILVNTVGINRFVAKIITEITFFSISWLVQKFVIFRKKNRGGQSTDSRMKRISEPAE
ncbi:MAG: bifunctional glycosyltransferase family 2/GtrA family protein [Eubacteriales bacterium]|jgi:putative flippase GtrA